MKMLPILGLAFAHGMALALPWIPAHQSVTLNFGLPTRSQWQLLAAVLADGLAPRS